MTKFPSRKGKGGKDRAGQSAATRLAQAGHRLDPVTGGVVPAMHLASTYARDADYNLIGELKYGRDHNPLYTHFESLLAGLEGGADARVFSAGMAAAAAMISTVRPGDTLVFPGAGYHGVRTWTKREAARIGFKLALYTPGDNDGLHKLIAQEKPRLVWVETPANPTWEVTSIRAAAEAAHTVGAKLVVDATVLSPVICKPLDLGADIVMHSASKYLSGHSDVIAGALVTKKNNALWQEISDIRGESGAILGPLEAWLLIRGMRTLDVRMERAGANAVKVADFLANHSKVERVLYPGLDNHPGHDIARDEYGETAGYGAMLSFLVKGGKAEALSVAKACRTFVPATSLGGTESLIEHRKSVESEDSPTPDALLRLSVGIEAVDDLIADLDQALSCL